MHSYCCVLANEFTRVVGRICRHACKYTHADSETYVRACHSPVPSHDGCLAHTLLYQSHAVHTSAPCMTHIHTYCTAHSPQGTNAVMATRSMHTEHSANSKNRVKSCVTPPACCTELCLAPSFRMLVCESHTHQMYLCTCAYACKDASMHACTLTA
jgi:hypothetical protein